MLVAEVVEMIRSVGHILGHLGCCGWVGQLGPVHPPCQQAAGKVEPMVHTLGCLLPLPRLEVLLLERDWPRLVVDLLVEAASIADNLP